MRTSLEVLPDLRISALPNGNLAIDVTPVSDMPAEEVWDKAQVAEFLQVTSRTVTNLMRSKRAPLPYSQATGQPRFLRSDVLAWLREEKHPRARKLKAALPRFINP